MTNRQTQALTTWTIALTGTFILALSLADVAATKIVDIWGITAPGGIFLFAVIFVVRDALHKTAGASYVRRTIAIGATLNLGLAFYLAWIATLPAPAFYTLAEPWGLIFRLAPAIVLGSIIAAVTSQLVNTWAYDRLWARGWGQAARVIGSNFISLPVDTILFATLAFYLLPPLFGATPLPLDAVLGRIVSGQIIIKAAVVLAMTPIIYLVPVNPEVRPS